MPHRWICKDCNCWSLEGDEGTEPCPSCGRRTCPNCGSNFVRYEKLDEPKKENIMSVTVKIQVERVLELSNLEIDLLVEHFDPYDGGGLCEECEVAIGESHHEDCKVGRLWNKLKE